MSTATSAPTATFPVNLRVREDMRDLIDRAAKAQGQTRNEFMLAAVERVAEETLLDQSQVRVDLATYEFMLGVLDEPAAGEGIKRLANAHRPWQS